MASHRLKSLYAIKECSTCGRLYTKECCSIGSLDDKILVPEPDSSPCCARCGTPVDGPSYRGCAFLRKDIEKEFACVLPSVVQSRPRYDYSGFDHPQPPQDFVYYQEALDKILKELEELKQDQRMLKELKKQNAEEQTVKENMSIEEMMHEQQLVDRKIKEITNDLGIRRFRGEEIDEEYERICEITIQKLKQDFNIWGSKVQKKEKAYKDEKYAAACRYMISVTCDDEDDYIALAIIKPT
ncbi:hypothetical protein Tco_0700063 [Tanacetum coccineum]